MREWAQKNQRVLTAAGSKLRAPRYVAQRIPPTWVETNAPHSMSTEAQYKFQPAENKIIDIHANAQVIVNISPDSNGVYKFTQNLANPKHVELLAQVAPMPGAFSAERLADIMNCEDQPTRP